ncbi:MAG: hypothetical protein HeimC3_44550 [Candidatus Heimdallarchaeota archaeon LC_3]|nr:MAG: hypothetical protein HeimC3_44550 [Candidatus Heimdallarchaeota archaeon LC_3]
MVDNEEIEEIKETKEKSTRKGKKSKRSKDKLRCTQCAYKINPVETPPNKTWQMISPLPDKMGRVTITIMGSFTCPKCGKSLRLAMQKIKSDSDASVVSRKQGLVTTIQELKKKTSLEEIAGKVGLSDKAVSKATSLLIKKGEIKGAIEDGYFVPEN